MTWELGGGPSKSKEPSKKAKNNNYKQIIVSDFLHVNNILDACLKMFPQAGWWRLKPLIQALWRQRQADLCESETSLVYKS